MVHKTRFAIVSLLVLIALFGMPCIALAADTGLQAGGVDLSVQSKKAIPGKAKLTKFRSTSAGKIDAVTVSVKGAKGYQFVIAKDKRFRRGVQKKKVSGCAEVSFVNLDGKKKYYGRVRAYTIVKGKVVWGRWSSVKSARVTQAVVGVVHLPGKRELSTKRWVRRGGVRVVDVTSDKVDPAKFDGLVVPGGGDVDPALYGQKRDSHDYGINRKLDLLEITVIQKFAKANKPVLGLCRGTQIINVAFGGTLCQHIKGWHKRYRKVKITSGSWLYKMFGATERVYHYHHQCVSTPGDGIIATQWDAKDGRVEAIEHVKYPVYGLQWHPEYMGKRGTKVARSFAALCYKYSKPRS